MSKYVSVVIATYNRPLRFLQEALKSLQVCHQNCKIEIIIVDDGSEEEFVKNLLEFLRDKPVRLIRLLHNMGCAHARNVGIEHAKGDWIFVLDDDDMLVPEAISAYLHAMDAWPDADVFYGDLVCFEDKTRKIVGHCNYFDFYERPEGLLNLLVFGDFLPHPGAMIRKEVIKRVGGYNIRLPRAVDYELWSRLASSARFKHIDAISIMYRVHKHQMTQRAIRNKDFEAEKQILKSMVHTYGLERLFMWLDWGNPLTPYYAQELVGIQFLLLGAWEEAVPYFETGAKHGNSWRQKLLLSLTLLLLGRRSEAKRMLKNIPNCALNEALLSCILSMCDTQIPRRVDTAKREIMKYLTMLRNNAIKVAVRHFGYHYSLAKRAKIYREQGLTDFAISLYKQALVFEPTKPLRDS